MKREIEVKYIVDREAFAAYAASAGVLRKDYIYQSYLLDISNHILRYRQAGTKHYLTYKGPNDGISRVELEFKIFGWAGRLLCKLSKWLEVPCVEKTRFLVEHNREVWEVDDFGSFMLAELEIEDVNYAYKLPYFCKENVSTDPRYFNSNIAKTL